MGSIDWKDLAARTAKTFVAAFVPAAAAIPTLIANGDFSGAGGVAVAAALAAGAAVVTFLWNLALQWGTA